MQGITMKLKMVMAGETNAGKTCFIAREMIDQFPIDHQSTIGIDFRSRDYPVGQEIVKVQLWDLSGSDRYNLLRKSHFNNSHAVCLCFSLNNMYTFQRLSYWLTGIRELTQSPIYLIGCQSDLPLAIPQEEIMKFASMNRLPYFACSAKEDIGVKECFKTIVEEVVCEILKNPEVVAKVRIQPDQKPNSALICQV